MLDGIQSRPKEQLSKGHEDLLSSNPRGLENVPRICWTFACTPLDHRCHPPSERLWWVHQISNEIYAATAGNMENIRSLTVVASEQQVQ
jgi:hypothetical protein